MLIKIKCVTVKETHCIPVTSGKFVSEIVKMEERETNAKQSKSKTKWRKMIIQSVQLFLFKSMMPRFLKRLRVCSKCIYFVNIFCKHNLYFSKLLLILIYIF